MPVAVPHQIKVATTQIMRSPQDAGEDCRNPRLLVAQNPDLCAVTHEGGSEVHEKKLHAFHARAKVFAGQAMSGFVKKGHGPEQEPEFNQVWCAFGGEVVEGKAVAPDLAEFVGPHPHHDSEHRQREQGEPSGVNEFEIGLERGQIVVGVGPCVQRYVSDVSDVKAPALFALAAHLLPERDVLFQRRFVEEVALTFEARGEFLHIVFSKGDVGLLVNQGGNLRVRALTIKQLKKLPLLWSKAQIDVAPRHFREHDWSTLLQVLLGDDAGIQFREAALRCGRR